MIMRMLRSQSRTEGNVIVEMNAIKFEQMRIRTLGVKRHQT